MTKRRPEREPPLKFSIPEIWQTTQGLAVRGWILTEDGPPEGLRVLFSKPLGWEVLGCELTKPVRLYPDQCMPDLLHLPSQSGFIHAAILARKIAEIDSEKFRWPVSLGNALGSSSHYPKPNNGHVKNFPPTL